MMPSLKGAHIKIRIWFVTSGFFDIMNVMATFFCTNCGERMCNSSNDNLFENYLIKTNVDYLEEKKYNKIVKE